MLVGSIGRRGWSSVSDELCSCGRPLHYTSPTIEAVMRDYVRDLGPTIPVEVVEGTFLVPRHYVALHGIKAEDVAQLAAHYGWAEA